MAFAVIPATAQPELAAELGNDAARGPHQRPGLGILQHGWRHADHGSMTGGKKSEFPAESSDASVAADLAAGQKRLRGLFGDRALPVLAPPWNRFAEAFLPLLSACGIKAISRANPRDAAWPASGVFAANVHVDLVAWKGDRGFIGEAAALAGLVGHLRARRRGEVDRDEPTGVLTHHLVQDEATGDFLLRLVALTAAHRAARWLDAREVFAPCLDAVAPASPGIAVPA
jgi:peptidoglycan/xylan/chitin deacetylase (PgdA/CDA1 family)